MDDELRLVLVAPVIEGEPEIPWSKDELPALGEIPGVDLTTTVGDAATSANISRALRAESAHQRMDGLVWAGHGTFDQLRVQGRRGKPAVIDGRWLATQLSQNDRLPKFALIAACNSGLKSGNLRSIGNEISDAGIHSIVMETEIKNSPAAMFTIEFVRAMAAKPDVRNAYLVALQATGLLDLEQAKMIQFIPAYRGDDNCTLEQRVARVETDILEIKEDVRSLVRLFSKNGSKP